MRNLVRPATFLGGLLCGVVVTVMAIGWFQVRAQQPPATPPSSSVEVGRGITLPAAEQPPAAPPGLPGSTPLPDPTPPSLPPPAEPTLRPIDPGGSSTTKVEGALEPEGDPEVLAGRYVEKTKAHAKNAIDSLTKEAETLRARLKKVEAALLRWQDLLTALDSRQNPPRPPQDAQEVPRSSRLQAPGPPPGDLQPIPRTPVAPSSDGPPDGTSSLPEPQERKP